MKKAIFLIGIPGSGKTILRNKLISLFLGNAFYTNMDEMRKTHFQLPISKIWQKSFEDVEEAIKLEYNLIIIDNTNFLAKFRKSYLDIFKKYPGKYKIEALYLNTPIEECIKRNKQRIGKARVPEKVIRDFAAKIQLPTLNEGFDEIIESR